MAVSHLWCHFALACATYDYRIFATGVVVALRALIRASGLNVHGLYTHACIYCNWNNMWPCLYIYINRRAHLNICIYIHICMYIYIHTYACMHACMHAYVHTYLHADLTHVNLDISYIYICIYSLYIHLYNICIYMYITCVCVIYMYIEFI